MKLVGKSKEKGLRARGQGTSSAVVMQEHVETQLHVKLGYAFLWLVKGIQSCHLSYCLAVVHALKAIFLGAVSISLTFFLLVTHYLHYFFFLMEGIILG